MRRKVFQVHFFNGSLLNLPNLIPWNVLFRISSEKKSISGLKMLPQITMEDVLKSIGLCAVYVFLMSLSCVLCESSELEDTENIDRFKIEGKVDLFSAGKNKDWISQTRVLVDGGDYVALLK